MRYAGLRWTTLGRVVVWLSFLRIFGELRSFDFRDQVREQSCTNRTCSNWLRHVELWLAECRWRKQTWIPHYPTIVRFIDSITTLLPCVDAAHFE
jgi:hypothetical protein